MNTRTLLRGADLAVPTATLRRVVAELRAHGGVRRGYLGVGAYPATAGARATSVAIAARSSRASRTAARRRPAGVLVGDILVELDGDAVDRPRRAARASLGDRAGKTVKIALVARRRSASSSTSRSGARS